MPADRELLELERLIMQLARLTSRMMREKGVGGLSLSQMRVLKRLSRQEERASDLASLLGVTPAAVTKLLDQLEKRGYVSRAPSRVDRRSTRVAVTASGKVALEKSERVRSATIQRLLQPLRKEEASVLTSTLRRLTAELPEAWMEDE
jgi:DNA-binding MarR family transcriptional regulator